MALAVSRYYKGSGPALLATEVSGIGQGQRMDWMAEPRAGDELLVAFRRDGSTLRNTVCNPFVILKPGEGPPTWVTDQFGPGVPPDGQAPSPEKGRKLQQALLGGYERGEGRPIPWLPLLGGVAFAAAVLAWAIRRLRHRRRIGK